MTDTRIMLAGGTLFDLADPAASEFTIGDIAHALGRVCRFAGHTNRFYSVAEHCVHVARLVPLSLMRPALLHDASEAFIGDVTRPLKAMLPDYREIEARVEDAISDRLLADHAPEDVDANPAYQRAAARRQLIHDPTIKLADTAMCLVEARELMPTLPGYWNLRTDPEMLARARNVRMNFDKPEFAAALWLRAWHRAGHWLEQHQTQQAADDTTQPEQVAA